VDIGPRKGVWEKLRNIKPEVGFGKVAKVLIPNHRRKVGSMRSVHIWFVGNFIGLRRIVKKKLRNIKQEVNSKRDLVGLIVDHMMKVGWMRSVHI
jgi:hypothetical protein